MLLRWVPWSEPTAMSLVHLPLLDRWGFGQLRNSQHQGSHRANHFDAIQILRGLAAMLVVTWHSRLSIMHADNNYWIEGDYAYRSAHYPAFLNHLDIGVDIFFCISGFIMNLLIHDENPTLASALRFSTNRAIRIIPPYWLFTALVLIAYVVSNGRYNLASLGGNPGSDGVRLLTSLLLIPQALPPILGVGWTLVHESLFYWVCALCILLGVNRRLPAVLAVMSVLSIVFVFLHVTVWHGYGFSPYLIEFYCGAIAYEHRSRLSRRWWRLQLWAAVCCYLALSALLDSGIPAWGTAVARPVVAGGMGILLICGSIGGHDRFQSSRPLLRAGLMRIGDASYSLYLSHWLVLSSMGKLLGLVPHLPTFAVAAWHAISILTAVTFAVAFAEYLELPAHRRLQAAIPKIRVFSVVSR